MSSFSLSLLSASSVQLHMSSTGRMSIHVITSNYRNCISVSTDKCSRYPLSRAAWPWKRRHCLQVSLFCFQGQTHTTAAGDTEEILFKASETVWMIHGAEYEGRMSPFRECDAILSFFIYFFLLRFFHFFTTSTSPRTRVLRRVPHCSPPLPSVHLSLCVRVVCVFTFIYLFWFEGCKRIWYWFGAVKYDSNWPNLSIVPHITCHDRRAPSSPGWTNVLRPCWRYDKVGICVVLFPTLCFLRLINPQLLSCFIEIEVLITAQTDLDLTEWSASHSPQQTQ